MYKKINKWQKIDFFLFNYILFYFRADYTQQDVVNISGKGSACGLSSFRGLVNGIQEPQLERPISDECYVPSVVLRCSLPV